MQEPEMLVHVIGYSELIFIKYGNYTLKRLNNHINRVDIILFLSKFFQLLNQLLTIEKEF